MKKIPFIRGIFNFIDSMILGTRCLNFSAGFYEEKEKETGLDKALDKASGGNGEKVLTAIVTAFSVILAVGIFIVLPYFLSGLLKGYIRNESLMAIIEGVIRIVIFLVYILAISLMKDIRRLFMYHGAEHKCINCIEHGRALNVRNVRRSSLSGQHAGIAVHFYTDLSVRLAHSHSVLVPVFHHYALQDSLTADPGIATFTFRHILFASTSFSYE